MDSSTRESLLFPALCWRDYFFPKDLSMLLCADPLARYITIVIPNKTPAANVYIYPPCCVSKVRDNRSELCIHLAGLIVFNQSSAVGMQPMSSLTCCSPIHLTGITFPVDTVIVVPKIRSHRKIPSV